VRRSNTAAMWLGLASYVANGDTVVDSDEAVQKVLPLMETLFLKQGYVDYSSEVPFQDYLTMGMGKSPLVMIYEAQFIEKFLKGQTRPDMVLIYPSPTVFTKHIFVPADDKAAALGHFLASDPEIQQLAMEFGLRGQDAGAFARFAGEKKLPIAGDLANVVDPPSFEFMEQMIQAIEQRYAQQPDAQGAQKK
jgi:hypothetical protein